MKESRLLPRFLFVVTTLVVALAGHFQRWQSTKATAEAATTNGRWLVGWLFVMLLLVGCGLSAGEQQALCTGETALFEDDFSGEQDCGWVLYNRGGAVAAIEEGAMQLSTSQVGSIWWTNPGQSFDDVVITVDAQQVTGPNNNAYGVICRYQDEQNFYLFLISGDGYYAIGKYQSGNEQVIYLTENGQYQSSSAINQGEAGNSLEVRCVGNELSLAVNGIPLLTVTDPTFVVGDVGLGVSTLAAGTAVVEFDNFRVVLPGG